jgi:hypothetical protein
MSLAVITVPLSLKSALAEWDDLHRKPIRSKMKLSKAKEEIDMTKVQDLEKLRNSFKPDKVTYLFVGESIPSNGTFFYTADSPLYKYTKEAFEEVFQGVEFSLKLFKDKGFYLFDLTESVAGMGYKEKINAVASGIPKLARFIEAEKPEYVLSVKNTNLSAIIMSNAEVGDLISEDHIFDLPAPIFGSHHYYKDKLVEALKIIYGIA